MAPERAQNIEIFSGWKDIASYMGKGVRTVQRYEREMRLPIRRPAGKVPGKSGGAVIAIRAEINAWVKTSPVRDEFRLSVHAIDNRVMLKGFRQEVTQMHRLHEETLLLRSELTAARKVLTATMESLNRSLRADLDRADQFQRLSSSGRRTADAPILRFKKKS
jgi:hypothetical protein